jgi:hypothetical protein
MPIPTKADCTSIVNQKTTAQAIADAVGGILERNAANGIVGGTIPYGPLGPGGVTVLVNALQNKNWTVVQDDTNRILTVS